MSSQFVNLLHEEEERIAKQADCLQRRSSMMKFNYVNTRSKVNNSNSSNVGSGSSSNADNTTAVTAAANSPTSPSTPADSAEQDTEAEIHLEDDNLK